MNGTPDNNPRRGEAPTPKGEGLTNAERAAHCNFIQSDASLCNPGRLLIEAHARVAATNLGAISEHSEPGWFYVTWEAPSGKEDGWTEFALEMKTPEDRGRWLNECARMGMTASRMGTPPFTSPRWNTGTVEATAFDPPTTTPPPFYLRRCCQASGRPACNACVSDALDTLCEALAAYGAFTARELHVSHDSDGQTVLSAGSYRGSRAEPPQDGFSAHFVFADLWHLSRCVVTFGALSRQRFIGEEPR
jgi:hypothetical protein